MFHKDSGVLSHMIVSPNRGTPNYTIILIMGTLKMVPLISGNPHICVSVLLPNAKL